MNTRAAADRIELRGLRVVGRHGVLDEERVRAQPFEVDIDLELDLHPAGGSDALADTVDYGAVAESVAAVVGGEHSELLEHLAERVARAVLAAASSSSSSAGGAGAAGGSGGPGIDGVTVAIRKVRPPVPVDLHSAGVRIHRRRDELDAGLGPSPRPDPSAPPPPSAAPPSPPPSAPPAGGRG